MGHNRNTKGWGHISNGRALGIDGARGGWVCAAFRDKELTLAFVPSISDLAIASRDRVLVDMPIGFPQTGPRVCDREAATFLGPRRSTIFPVPCRAAVEARSYEEACERNAQLQGKKLSLQLWNIVPKMRELDLFLRGLPSAHDRVAEGHPEIAFACLSPADVPLAPKRSPEGRAIRLEILSRAAGQDACGVMTNFCEAHKPRVAMDDALDAAALAIFLASSQEGIVFFGDGAHDEHGVPMRIGTAPSLTHRSCEGEGSGGS